MISSLYSQISDTVTDISIDCLNKENINGLQFHFENDSIKISGEILMNCFPRNYFLREMREDSIFLITTDTCIENCLCLFDFSTSLPDPGYDSIYASIGYQCLIDGHEYEHYLDTLIFRNLSITENLSNDPLHIFPNPAQGLI